jgi:hypothetical protein
LKHVGTADWYREKLNVYVNTPASWSAHALRMQLGMPSGPAALRGFKRLNVLLTLVTEKESPQSLVAGRVCGTVLSSKRTKKVFSLSGSKMSVSATWLVFLLYSVIVCRPCHICLVSEQLNSYSTLSLTFDFLRWLIQRFLPLPRFGSFVQIIMAFVVL